MKKKNLKDINLESISKAAEKLRKKEPRLSLTNYPVIDLIPPSHKDIVEVQQLKKSWFYVCAFVAGLCMIAIAVNLVIHLTLFTQIKQQEATQSTQTVEIAKYADVNTALDSQKEIVGLLNKAAGNEIDWNALVNNVQSSLPSDTRIVSISVTNGGTAKDKPSTAIILNLSSSSTISYSDALGAVQGLGGVSNVKIGGASIDSGTKEYIYTMSFTYDNSLLTNRFGTGAN